jgi:hypothetical protein
LIDAAGVRQLVLLLAGLIIGIVGNHISAHTLGWSKSRRARRDAKRLEKVRAEDEDAANALAALKSSQHSQILTQGSAVFDLIWGLVLSFLGVGAVLQFVLGLRYGQRFSKRVHCAGHCRFSSWPPRFGV